MFSLPAPGEAVDATPFAVVSYWTGSTPETIKVHAAEKVSGPAGERWWQPVDVEEQGGPHIGLQWESPRRFSRIVVRYAPGQQLPEPASVKVQYWHRSWPQHEQGGWTEIDDQFNGRWVTAKTDMEDLDSGVSYSFLPLDKEELGRDVVGPVKYRVAYKVRLLFPKALTPAIHSIQALGDYQWKEVHVRIEFGCAAGSEVPREGTMEVHNGYGSVGGQACGQGVQADWELRKGKVLKATALMADTDAGSFDRTICTIRTKALSFSFLPAELENAPIFLKDFGVFVSTGVSYAGWTSSRPPPASSVYDRVAGEPEQSYERASKEIPQLVKTRHGPWGRYVPLGCDDNRQEIAVLYNGDILIDHSALKSQPTGREPLLWPEGHLRYRIMGGNAPTRREGEDETAQEILENHLPVLLSAWTVGSIQYRQQNFAALLDDTQDNEPNQRGDETTVMFGRVVLRNLEDRPATAHLWIAMDHPEELVLREEGLVLVAADLKPQDGSARKSYEAHRLRLYFNKGGTGDLRVTSSVDWPSILRYSIELEPKGAHAIEYRIPFVTLQDKHGWETLRALDHDAKLAETLDYWRREIASGAKMEVPEPLLNEFNRGQLTHIAITADKDPTTRLMMVPAATFGYNVCANEAMHQVRALEVRGHHRRAERYLEPFIQLQGTRNLHGRYKSAGGALHGLRVSEDTDYQTFNYNLDHGFVLWMLAEHYKFTRDREWANRVAPNLVAACDFITRERKATMLTDSEGRKVWQYGLLPEGHLEDPPEFHHWYAVNSYAARGIRDAAEVLAEIGHPEAKRIKNDADAFMSDLRRAAKESMIRAPVVRLTDATSVPFQPTRCLLSGRDIGWIRDALYGPIHLIACGVHEADSPEAVWILKDAEDNVFPRPERGRFIENMEKHWFSQGGITLQSNLLPNPLIYLKRGQPEHAIRAFYNSFAANLYRDVLVFCEHPIEGYGRGAGPFFKSPDESAFIVWFRHLLLMEDGDTLQITPGAPRAWFEDGKEIECENMPSYFGPLSFSITSEAAKGLIVATVRPPKRSPPRVLELHFRHPDKKPIKSVTVNGAPHKDFDADGGIVRFAGASSLPDKVILKVRY